MTLATDPSESLLAEAAAGRAKVVGLTVEQYHEMIKLGYIPETPSVELIDGLLVYKDRSAAGEDPMGVGDRHKLGVQRMVRQAPRFHPHGCYLQIQQPITLPPNSEPEPDISVIRGTEEDFADSSPAPADVLSVIEISDSSLRRDRTIKYRLYGSAKIPQYILADLVNNVVLVHEAPANGKYTRITELRGKEMLRIAAGADQGVEIPAELLLP